MLTSFFSKSRPIIYVFVAGYMLVFFGIANFREVTNNGFPILLQKTGGLLALLMSVFILNFVSKRNELTSRNAFKSVLFAAFCSMFLATLFNDAALVANFLVLLALRRIISLRTQRDTVKKIFDATLWIGVASILYFWSILFLFLVYFGILVHEGHRFKNWLIPIVALIILFSITTSIDLLFTNTFYTFSNWLDPSNFDFSMYREPGFLIPLALLLALTMWAGFFFIGVIQKASAANKTSLFIILLFTFLSLTVAFFAPTKNSSELIFFFAPLAVIVTNYFQVSEDKWFREILLWVVLLLPVMLVIFF
jgi:hypothetical protein